MEAIDHLDLVVSSLERSLDLAARLDAAERRIAELERQ